MQVFAYSINNSDQRPSHFKQIIFWLLSIIFITKILLTNQTFDQKSVITQSSPSGIANDQQHFTSCRSDFDVVLSYYNEDIKFVTRFLQHLRQISIFQKLRSRIIIYNKNSRISIRYLRKALNVDLIYRLPNIGRESGTYLYHIITNYDQLANHIFFCQAGVEGMRDNGLDDWFVDRLEKQFNRSVGYMPMVDKNWMAMFDCGEGPNENVKQLPQLWGIIEQTLCPLNKQAIFFRGQFVVSAKRIRNRPIRIYRYINDMLIANQTHWIHRDKSTPKDPQFGHVVERLWTTLFNCTHPDIFVRCAEHQCACFDH